MSVLKPSILINPQYATNTIDTHQAGWYQIVPNASNLALRVNYSNIGLQGEIRLNTSTLPYVFQGNNGSAWVDFNAVIGPTGAPGQDFTNAVNFNNLGSNTSVGSIVPLANIFATTYANVGAAISNVNIRSLQGGTTTINSNLTVDSMILTQNSNVITLATQPIPFNWDFTGSVNSGSTLNTVSNLKNTSSDTNFYSWGETSKWIVQQGQNIVKGQAVRLTRDSVSSSNIVITPITYTTLSGLNPFTTPFNILGIATQSASGGNSCSVCTKGITTVLCTNNYTPSFLGSIDVTNVGLIGLVGTDGLIFCATTVNPLIDYYIAGYFLESGSGVSANGNYALFYVNPQVHIG